MTPGDYRRWKREGREDILRYAMMSPRGYGWGILWFDPVRRLEVDYCPFLVNAEDGSKKCSIQDTKPRICREFYCEMAYDEGKEAVPFKVLSGWSNKAIRLGYGKAKPRNDPDDFALYGYY